MRYPRPDQGDPDQGCCERTLNGLISDPRPEHLFAGFFQPFKNRRFFSSQCFHGLRISEIFQFQLILVNFNYSHILDDEIMEFCDQTPSENIRDDLIHHYVAICNQALESNRDKFPYKQIFSALEKLNAQDPIEVFVADTLQTYAFYFSNDGVKVFKHDDCDECNCIRKWTTTSRYLNNVVTEPDLYIQNPARLNWDWLYGN